MQHQHGAGPVDRAGKQQAYHQRPGEITLGMFKLRGEMREGFQTDKAPEHHRQRQKELPAVNLRRGREGDLRRAYPAAPPDYDDQRHNQYGNQRLQVGAGAGATRTDPPDDGQGAQLRQQQLRIMPAEQRLAKTGGDVQGGGESDRDNR